MTDLNEGERRARSIVERSGGVVRPRTSEHFMTIEIAADAVWKVCVLPLNYVGHAGDRMFYDVDLSAMRLPVFGGWSRASAA